MVSDPPGLRWDDGDATFVAGNGIPGNIPTTPPAVRDATPAEWNAILEHPQSPTPTTTPAEKAASEPSTTTQPTTAP